MSARISPDGMYYWDGAQWVSTLSRDGRYRWNGSAWQPVGAPYYAGTPYVAPRVVRTPTSWTRPLQYAVAGWYALSALYSLSLPFWMSGMVATIMDQTFQRQAALNPDVSPPPAELVQSMTTFMNGIMWVGVVIGFGICVFFIIGALQRWTWIYYVVLVLLGLGALQGPLNLVNIFNSSAYASATGYAFPTSFYVVGLIVWIPSTALFVWMLVALVRRGPWGMVRVT